MVINSLFWNYFDKYLCLPVVLHMPMWRSHYPSLALGRQTAQLVVMNDSELMDTESYQEMRNSLGILKLLAEGEKDIENGNVYSQEEVFDEIETKLKAVKNK